ncbi:gustatory receptor for sugar taste 64f-like [Homalodisca vitripennis]|uniref:gustatory receptor for sugar taste 64f-like n=1 Tax=Homalodisca vitripennis TaxID=197043 RepID=UPI001EEBB789|nr:gustatory receptor for sugar taste 64f-like [Homalodisca vitripennis]
MVLGQKDRSNRMLIDDAAQKEGSEVDDDYPSISKQLRRYFSIAHWCLLFPVDGVTKEDGHDVRFSWTSNATIFSLLSLVISSFSFLAVVSQVLKDNVNYYRYANSLISSLVSVLLKVVFLMQARHWPAMIKQWASVERKLKPLFEDLSKHEKSVGDYNMIMNVYLAATLILIVTHYLLSLELALQCSESFFEVFNLTIAEAYFDMYSATSFSLWKAIIPTVLHVQERLIWMLMDLYVILLSRSICSYFVRINQRLIKVQHKSMPTSFWLFMRESYNSVTFLTKQLDSHLAWMNLYCFGSPLFFITSAILETFSAKSVLKGVADLYKLVYVIGRFIITSHSASALHDESKVPVQILFSVPAESYNTEVARFQTQTLHCDTALTGCNYFSITRSFMLTVAGTIVTYEVILLQFGSVEFYYRAKNMTEACNILLTTIYSGDSRIASN